MGTPASSGRAVVPVRLQVPAARIDAAIDSEGVNADGDMALPETVNRVGWYRFGPAPGSAAGAIVLAGHVDSAQQGRGGLFPLAPVPRGTDIVVTKSDGRGWHYRLLSRELFAKRTIPLGQIFARTGPPHLTIITCGGSFDRAALSYDDNVVVTAVAR